MPTEIRLSTWIIVIILFVSYVSSQVLDSEVCIDLHRSCPQRVRSCATSANVRLQCRRTCNLCPTGPTDPECSDENALCARLANRCDNIRVRNQCKKTCNACEEVEKGCADGAARCADLVERCNEPLVRNLCKKTCNACEESEEDTEEEGCVDDAARCADLVDRCDEARIRNRCKKTCNACEDSEGDEDEEGCVDDVENCATVVKQCNEPEVRNRCKKTCNACEEHESEGEGEGCVDGAPRCTNLVERCDEPRVRNLCKKTCNACEESEEDEDEEGCTDDVENCATVIERCDELIVRNRCKKTCNACEEDASEGEEEGCVDDLQRCRALVTRCGEPRVRQRCRKTCNACDEDEDDEDDEDSDYSEWTEYDKCSVTCGGGIQTRTRECLTEICAGHTEEIRNCKPKKCPDADCADKNRLCPAFALRGLCRDSRVKKNCAKSCKLCEGEEGPSWSEYGPCSVSCGVGMKTRTKGETSQSITCFQDDCELETPDCEGPDCEPVDDLKEPEYTEWTEYGKCSEKCGGGIQTRTRDCQRDSCKEHTEEIQNCAEEECPVTDCKDTRDNCKALSRQGYCRFSSVKRTCQKSCKVKGCDGEEASSWSAYGPCSVPCGVGVKTRTKGEVSQSITCFQDDCGSDEAGVWSEWTAEGGCSKTCGGGTRVITRSCSIPNKCKGDSRRTRPCQTESCPEWKDWEPWGECSVTCGPGTKSRQRECTVRKKCEGPDTETEECNEEECKKDPQWDDWSKWRQCSKICGGGERERERKCKAPGECDGDATEREACNTEDCPRWAKWSEWSKCTLTCGRGTKLRARTCTVNGKCGNLPGTSQEFADCNTQPCPDWGDWSDWSECTTTCGGGEKTRVRSCKVEGACKDLEGGYEETQECSTNICPEWTRWSFWSRCSATCGGGKKTRTRFCSMVDQCGNLPEGKEQIEDCNEQPCAGWGAWSLWSPCTFSCGGGTMLRARTCTVEGECDDLPGETEESEKCNTEICPTWNDWEDWSPCSKTCGEGEKTRTRTCTVPNQCDGEPMETEKCKLKDCDADGKWTRCSKSCGGGTRRRYHCNGTECMWQFEPCGEGKCADAFCLFTPALSSRYEILHSCCPTTHIPAEEQCGRQAGGKRIIGGVGAQSEQWPWMVAVYMPQGGFCGGILISKNFVLSAAHCFAFDTGKPRDTTNWLMYVGVLKLSELGQFPDLGVPVKRTFIHPSYNFPVADIALVELQHDVSFTSTIQPLCLPWGEETPYDSTCIVAGWGVSNIPDVVTSHLQELAILNYDPLVCAEAYGKLESMSHHVPFLKADKGFMCAGSLSRKIDSCSGDSGGPLMCQRCDSCTWYIAGIVSFGPNPCAELGVPGVYTKVVQYEDWIIKTTGMKSYSLKCSTKPN